MGKQFKFTIARDLTESICITVEAATIEEAHVIATKDFEDDGSPNDFNFSDEWIRADTTGGKIYLPDESDWEEVEETY